MLLDPSRLVRGATVSQYNVSRVPSVGSKKAFGQKLTGFGQTSASSPNLLASLDNVHQKIRGCADATQLADLLDEYVALTVLLAGTYPAAPFVPGGSVLSAAITALGGLKGSGG